MADINKDIRVVSLVQQKDIGTALKNMLDQLQRCQKSLNEFLEVKLFFKFSFLLILIYNFSTKEKRSIFPRFYFIGDDDLLEILGQATNPNVIQTHLKKLFAGIHSVKFDEKSENIMAMKSLEGEIVPLTSKVKTTLQVEVIIN
jgi:dynein heavy chain 2